MARSSVEDPLKNFRFLVYVDGFARAGFSACSKLESSTEDIKYREGGDNTSPKKSAGLTDFANITLKRGVIIDEAQNDFYNWMTEVHDVQSKGIAARDYRRDIEIVEVERGGLVVVRWRVVNAFPVRFLAMSDLEGLGNDSVIEELELAHEGFSKVP